MQAVFSNIRQLIGQGFFSFSVVDSPQGIFDHKSDINGNVMLAVYFIDLPLNQVHIVGSIDESGTEGQATKTGSKLFCFFIFLEISEINKCVDVAIS